MAYCLWLFISDDFTLLAIMLYHWKSFLNLHVYLLTHSQLLKPIGILLDLFIVDRIIHLQMIWNQRILFWWNGTIVYIWILSLVLEHLSFIFYLSRRNCWYAASIVVLDLEVINELFLSMIHKFLLIARISNHTSWSCHSISI